MNKDEVCIGEEYYLQMLDKVNGYDKLKELYEKMYNENCILRENAEHNDKVVDNVNWKLNKYKEVLDKIKEYIKNHIVATETEQVILELLEEIE